MNSRTEPILCYTTAIQPLGTAQLRAAELAPPIRQCP